MEFPVRRREIEFTEVAFDVVCALGSGLEWNEVHEYLLSDHHLHRLSDKMKLSSFLRLSKVKTKPSLPCRVPRNQLRELKIFELAPQLYLVPRPLVVRNPTVCERFITYTLSKRTFSRNTADEFNTVSNQIDMFPEETKPPSQNLQLTPLIRDQRLRVSRIGSPPRMLRTSWPST